MNAEQPKVTRYSLYAMWKKNGLDTATMTRFRLINLAGSECNRRDTKLFERDTFPFRKINVTARRLLQFESDNKSSWFCLLHYELHLCSKD